MKSLFLLAAVMLAAAPAKADLTHKIQSSVSLTVDGAASAATRIGSSYSVTGNNITLDTAHIYIIKPQQITSKETLPCTPLLWNQKNTNHLVHVTSQELILLNLN